MADNSKKHKSKTTFFLDRPDIEIISKRESGNVTKLYDLHFLIARGKVCSTFSVRKFAADTCDGPAIAEISTFIDEDLPMFKIHVFAAPKVGRDRPLSTIRFPKDVVVISRTVYSKPTSFKTLAIDELGGTDLGQHFGKAWR